MQPRYVPLVSVHPARDRKRAYADAKAGLVPAFQLRPGGRWYVDAEEWTAFVESRKAKPAVDPSPRPAA